MRVAMQATKKAASTLKALLFPFFTLTLISLPAFAELNSTLKLPAKAELLVLDGKAANDLDLDRDESIKLTKKRHQVVFELKETLGSGDNMEQFTSRPFVISFHPLDGHHYLIEAPRLINKRQADAINRDPASKITVVDEQQKEVPFEIAILPSRGIQIGRNYAADVRKFNQSDNAAALPELAGVQMDEFANGFANARQDSSVYSGANNNTPDENIMAERMLKYWYMEADNATRKSFLDWAAKQK
ncbi:DUF2057 domain-containing protein [Endozoicomonas gorgoniicola]|uniref:DUF2057 domain-containing protein n=1 Tax=Endozoicomonas gorgoniicola TaxID=1234144 RepID=A0ABT3MZ10_9GAMM|nr:DUF2057 domain-containing protein [Endozoicomonas gorgoniicola]MCW7554618.1 DUF2057 domain-containing protein [Endozoicomonas gorgoniicola]